MTSTGRIDPQILEQGTHDEKGDNAKLQYFVGAIAVGDMIKTTLGPHGMDKILLPVGTEAAAGSAATITNDGATILKKIWIDNPAAQILVDLAKTQDKTVGDGTTGVVVLSAELLRQAEILVNQKLHSQVIAQGYHRALQVAQKACLDASFSVDEATKRAQLLKLATTTLRSKLVCHDIDHFAAICVDAILKLDGSTNLELIQVIKRTGGTMKQSYLDEGFILEKGLPPGFDTEMVDCKVMLADTPMDADKIKIFGARVKAESFDAVKNIEDAEKAKMKRKVNAICEHDMNVFLNRQLIYDYPNQCFRSNNVLPIEHADFDGIERLASVLDGDIAATFDSPGSIKIGTCKKIEEISIGDSKCLHFTGCAKSGACTIVLRGPNSHVLAEAERSIHDALAVLSQTVQDGRFVYGGGSIEMHCAEQVEEDAKKESGKISLAIEAYAKALRAIPTILVDNGGYDSAQIVSTLRSLHHSGQHTMGANLETGSHHCMKDLGVVESYWSKSHQIRNASEAASMIIRVDEVIRCAPRKRAGV